MPIVIVEQEQNVTALAARLLKARTSKAATERAVRAIREANPGLDLDRLRPGAVVVVPPLKEARTSAGDLVEPAVAEIVDQLKEALNTLADGARTALEADRAEREDTAKVFDSDEVNRAAEGDSVLRNALDVLSGTLNEDEDSAVRNTEILLNGIERWAQDLDDLSGLV